MEVLHELKRELHEELEELSRKPMNSDNLEMIHKLTDTIKNIMKICMMDEEGYSDDGYSSANRGKHYVRGHYSRDDRPDRMDGMDGYSDARQGGRRDSRGRYSRDDGRSAMMEHLEMAMDSATEQDRETIKRFMRQLENA